MNNKETTNIESKIKSLELITNSALPLSAAGIIISAAVGAAAFPFALATTSVIGASSLFLARRYAKRHKQELMDELNTVKQHNQITEEEYLELEKSLNSITVSKK